MSSRFSDTQFSSKRGSKENYFPTSSRRAMLQMQFGAAHSSFQPIQRRLSERAAPGMTACTGIAWQLQNRMQTGRSDRQDP
jgi:hypothetical protein